MVALEIWYRQRVGNDYGTGDPALVVNSADELTTLLDRVLRETRDDAVSPMIEVSVAGDVRAPVLESGLGPTYGFVHCLAVAGGWTVGEESRVGTVGYDYMGHRRDVPANAEIAVETVRAALVAFGETGRWPEWVPLRGE